SFFNIFSFPLIQGNPATVLSKPNSVVLTKSTAQKYFGNQNPVGQTLRLRNGQLLKVTGIIANVPHNSSIQFDILASFKTLNPSRGMDDQGSLYVMLRRASDAKVVKNELTSLTEGSMNEIGQRLG